MAKHKQLWLKGSKGKLAGTTFYQTAGVTIQREINYDPSNPRTDKQMTQRTKLANLVNMYRAGKSFFPRAFENKKALESDYNKFVSYNLTDSPVYLTKGEAAKGFCVPAAYQISQGSLVSMGAVVNTSGKLKVAGTSSSSLSANATIAQLTELVLAGYPQAQVGDQLSFIFWHVEDTDVRFDKLEIILSDSDTTKITDSLHGDFAWTPTDGLNVDETGFDVAGAAVLSRTVAGKTLVSSERLVVNEATGYTAHTGDAAQAAAITSYGASKKVFLDNK